MLPKAAIYIQWEEKLKEIGFPETKLRLNDFMSGVKEFLFCIFLFSFLVSLCFQAGVNGTNLPCSKGLPFFCFCKPKLMHPQPVTEPLMKPEWLLQVLE